uniref:hypothetical protein n=1 Tax=Mariniflexile sp. TaxID=1979402 RepID=UPI004047A340
MINNKGEEMSYVTISKWKNDPDFDRDVAIDIVQQKYVSATLALGAENVYFVELPDNQTRVISVFPTQAIAAAAAEKQAAVRAQGEKELKTKLVGVEQGEVFASGQA